MSDELVIYTEQPKGNSHRGSFLYAKVSRELALKVKHKYMGFCGSNPDGVEYHLTTNGAYERYIVKRLNEPKFVRIFDTQAEMDNLLEDLGYWR